MTRFSLLFALLFCGFMLQGCSSTPSKMHTLEVRNSDNLIFAVYIDSQYIGETPISYDVLADTINGARLKIAYKGNVLKSYTLRKDSIDEEKNERQKTATALATVATVAGAVFIPYPLALITPFVAYIPALSFGNPKITGEWNYQYSIHSFPEFRRNKELIYEPLHPITNSWFIIKRGHNIPATTYYWSMTKDLIMSSGVCYDEENKTVWFASDDKENVFYPVPDKHVTHCLDTVVTKKTMFGQTTPVIDDRTCGYLPEHERDVAWFRQYPCEKFINKRKF